jgi:exportin-1
MESAKQSTDILNNAGQIKVLSNVLKTNVSACLSVGPGYISQLSQIYMDLLTLYRAVGVIVSQHVTEQGKAHLYYNLYNQLK